MVSRADPPVRGGKSLQEFVENGAEIAGSGGTVLQAQAAGFERGLGVLLTRGRNSCRGLRPLSDFTQLDNGRIGNFPAKGLHMAQLVVALFQEDGLAGIGSQLTGCRENDISCAVAHFDSAS